MGEGRKLRSVMNHEKKEVWLIDSKKGVRKHGRENKVFRA